MKTVPRTWPIGSGDLFKGVYDLDQKSVLTFDRTAKNASRVPMQMRGLDDPTIDQIIADAIGGDSPYASLETGICTYTGLNMGTVSTNLAHRGPYDFLPPERDPKALFDRLFSDLPQVTPPGTEVSPTAVANQLRKSVLDAVLEDAELIEEKHALEFAVRRTDGLGSEDGMILGRSEMFDPVDRFSDARCAFASCVRG
ncbi:MAG: DUF1552 domain-containing protein [Anaerolineae bacterium]|nr:DUF1552 domain-containing protein [Anaerolineae bacterium]